MDVTQKTLQDELKYLLEINSSTRLKKADWQAVNNLHFFESGKISLNECRASLKSIEWDLYHIFKFTNLKTLSIKGLRDTVLLSAGSGPQVFDFKFWFDNFPLLEGLTMKSGSFDDRKESIIYRVKLKDETNSWIVYDVKDEKESAIQLLDNEHKIVKSFYFGKSKNYAKQWFLEIVRSMLENKEFPNDIELQKIKDKKLESPSMLNYRLEYWEFEGSI